MLHSIPLGIINYVVKVVEITNTAQTVDATNLTSYSFASVNFGAADASRIISVHVAGPRASAGARTVSSMTIGGVSASLIVRQTSVAGDADEIWHAAVPSGATGTISITFSAGMEACCIGVFRVLNASTTISDTATASGTTLSAALTIPTDGGAIGGAYTVSDSSTHVWANLTKQYEADANPTSANRYSGALSTTPGTPTITMTKTAPQTDDTMVLAAYAKA